MRLASRMNSREARGSAAMPTRPSRPETKPSISSRMVSMSLGSAGAWSEPTRFTGTPAVEPGV